MLALFPDSARVAEGELTLGGVRATQLAAEHGTPLRVYCEETIRAQARAYRDAAPGASLVYGTKAFANVGLLRVLADEGFGADVSTLGELAFALAAGLTGERLLFHGNNKSDEELRAAAEAGATVVLDAPDEPARAAAEGVGRVLVRLTPGVEALTHHAVATAHDSSKFGLGADAALGVIEEARGLGLRVAGVHFHVGSQLARVDESLLAVERLAAFCSAPATSSAGDRPSSTSAAASASATRGTTGCRTSRGSSVPSSPACTSAGPIPCSSCSSRDARSSAGPASRSTASARRRRTAA
jgi:diaminopimelate decarboxylase